MRVRGGSEAGASTLVERVPVAVVNGNLRLPVEQANVQVPARPPPELQLLEIERQRHRGRHLVHGHYRLLRPYPAVLHVLLVLEEQPCPYFSENFAGTAVHMPSHQSRHPLLAGPLSDHPKALLHPPAFPNPLHDFLSWYDAW